jgi:hypothetical protein
MVTYETGGVTHSVFILDAANLSGNRDAVPVPVFARGPEGFTKTGYAYRSPSGRAFVISTTAAREISRVKWSALQRIIHRECKQAQVSRFECHDNIILFCVPTVYILLHITTYLYVRVK